MTYFLTHLTVTRVRNSIDVIMLVYYSEETPKKEPVAASGDADAAAETESGDVSTTPAATPAATTATASGSSPPASPTAATSPPMSPQRQLEAGDEMTSSVVRCLAFADTFLMTGKSSSYHRRVVP